jgi:hypothetical protein
MKSLSEYLEGLGLVRPGTYYEYFVKGKLKVKDILAMAIMEDKQTDVPLLQDSL